MAFTALYSTVGTVTNVSCAELDRIPRGHIRIPPLSEVWVGCEVCEIECKIIRHMWDEHMTYENHGFTQDFYI